MPRSLVTGESREADLDAIAKLHKADIEATLTQDPNSLSSLWSEDGVNLGFPDRPVVGIKAMREAYQNFQMANPDFQVLKYVPDISEIQLVEGWAIELVTSSATYKMAENGEPVTVQTTGMRLLKRQSDGSWKFALVGLK